MEDSFFGFNTTLPYEDGGGRITEPSEEEYDALNDETFGSAINGDWESAHENMVRLTGDDDNCTDVMDNGTHDVHNNTNVALNCNNRKVTGPANKRSENLSTRQSYSKDLLEDSDLELNLATMKLDDVDLKYDDNDGASRLLGDSVNLGPGVWSLQPSERRAVNTNAEHTNNVTLRNGQTENPEEFLRQHFSSPFRQSTQPPYFLSQVPMRIPPPVKQGTDHRKISTLEDIERNLIMKDNACKDAQRTERNHQNENTDDVKEKHVNILENVSSIGKRSITQQQIQQTQEPQVKQRLPLSQNINEKKDLINSDQPLIPRPNNYFVNNLSRHPLTNIMMQPHPQSQQPLQQQQQQQQQPLNQALKSQQHMYNLQQQYLHQQPHPSIHMNPPGSRLPPMVHFPPPHVHPIGHPPLMPPRPVLNHQGFPIPPPRQLSNPHLPIALNNFAMHPNFNAIRAANPGIHPTMLIPQQGNRMLVPHPPLPLLQSHNIPNTSYNMFNMRLMQEIQQNHPLLRQAQVPQNTANGTNNNNTTFSNSLQQSHQQRINGLRGNMRRDGNLHLDDFDDYANLMSTRDKHWLIGIQLTQLNTDTPYIDDYYYTVYKERKALESGSIHHSQAHKDNQLNHPLTQPKGHAQLILVQLGNKNGLRNGQHHDKRHSDNHHNNMNIQDFKLPSYVFNPLKFENSLGKLQYVSVTAPRKIIDVEIMNSDLGISGLTSENSIHDLTKSTSSQLNADSPTLVQSTSGRGDLTTANNQRKCRHILLHIESLYRILLKLDDLNNPNAIATILIKKKKENERIAALEQLETATGKSPEDRIVDTVNIPSLKNKFNYEIETKEALVKKLMCGLKHDKIIAMMNVRKGKILIRRILAHIEDDKNRWYVWIAVFNALQNVLKKDRDDVEGILYSLYPEFKKQIRWASFDIIVKISSAISWNDKKSNSVFCSKFGISALVCLILEAERKYVEQNDVTLTIELQDNWRQFLGQVAIFLNRAIQNQTICATIEADSIQPIMDHFARFQDLELDSLLDLINAAKQQIN